MDDQKSFSRYDSSNLLGALGRLPDFMISQLHIELPPIKKSGPSAIRSVVFIGMGGSASSGDVVLDWLMDKISIPSMVHRNPVLPKFVGSDTFSIVLSYSGDTRETIVAFREARKRGSKIVSIGTGGKLQRLSKELDVPFVVVGQAPAPRAALGQMVVASAMALHGGGIISDVKNEIVLTVGQLRRLRGRIDQRVPFAENQAKRFATLLKDRLPVIFASSRMAAVARRFKNQLAENSKIQAKYSVLPEAAHNEIEAWHDQRFPLTPVFVRARSESELERSMLESFRSAITKASGTTPQQVRLKANTRLSEILLPVLFLDYVSVYLAILRRVDPIDTPWIRFYKEGR